MRKATPSTLTFRLQRVYDYVHEAPHPSPTTCYWLVDRLWPRGIARAQLTGVEWAKSLAPSAPLRRWFHEDALGRWEEFSERYREELALVAVDTLLAGLRERGINEVVLLYASKEPTLNHALILQAILAEHAASLETP